MFESSRSQVTTAMLWTLAVPSGPSAPTGPTGATAPTGPTGATGRLGARPQAPRIPATLEHWAYVRWAHVRRHGSAAADAAIDELALLQRRAAAVAAAEVRTLVSAAGVRPTVRRISVPVRDRDGQAAADGAMRDWDLVDERIEQIAAALNRSPEHVYSQLETARLLVGPLAATLEALEAGHIGYLHARAIAEAAGRMEHVPWGEDEQADADFGRLCRRLEARVLGRARRLTIGKTRYLAARTVTQLDPAGAQRRRAAAWSGCDVWVRPHYDGLARLGAVLPALDAARMIATIDTAVQRAVQAGAATAIDLPAGAGLGPVRAAVLTELVAGPVADPVAGAAPVPGAALARRPSWAQFQPRMEIGVVVDAATLLGLNPESPAWVATGEGFVDIDRAELIDLLSAPGVDATIRRLVTDPATGALVDRGARVYRVGENLRRWIRARDVTCSFPGCNRTARSCDIDHALDFDEGGPTTVTNTRALCRRHHNLKTHSAWRIIDAKPDGSCTFVAPDGNRYRHDPVPIPGSIIRPELGPGPQPPPRPEPPPF